MAKLRRVILYGESLILGSLGASLRDRPDLEIVPLAAPLPQAQELDALAPDAILFDLEAAQPEAALQLLKTRPQLLLIGIDPASEEMLIFSGRQERAVAVADVLRVIHRGEAQGQ
jgi:hypothetical protein